MSHTSTSLAAQTGGYRDHTGQHNEFSPRSTGHRSNRPITTQLDQDADDGKKNKRFFFRFIYHLDLMLMAVHGLALTQQP